MTTLISRLRQIVLLCFVGLIFATVAGYAGYLYERSRVVREAFTRLTLYHDLRKATLEDYMRSKASDVTAMGRNSQVREAFDQLNEAWSKLGPDPSSVLRRLYIEENPYPKGKRRNRKAAGDGSEYTAAHFAFHDWTIRFLEHFGYYDVFLIDDTGSIIYTAEKEDDFATSLSDGPYAGSPLGLVFTRALNSQSDRVFISDYERYPPSNNEPALFAASAIRSDDGRVAGVFAVQLSSEPINEILHFNEGMGKSGETYIVGNDLKMRSQSRFSSDSTVLTTLVETPAVERGLAGFSGAELITDYRGVPVFSVFSPLDSGGPIWVLLAEIDEAEVLASVRYWPAILAALLAAMSGAVFCFLALDLRRKSGRS